MTVDSVAVGLMQRLAPFRNWLPRAFGASTRPDIDAGIVGAILILPQAFALASLAGMPPEYGIYTSIFPVIIAALWGSSWHTLSGPNTAVCVLIAFSVAPFASVGDEYFIGYVLALTFMVGAIQLAVGAFHMGGILDFVSHTVVQAIVLAVGLFIIVSAAAGSLGVLANIGEPFFIRVYQIVHDIPRANGYAVAVAGITVISGLVARRFWRRYALVIAFILGTLSSVVFNYLVGPANTGLELLGYLSLKPVPLSHPSFDLESMYVLKEMVSGALAISFLGLMQTVVIARSLANKSGQHVDTNQEIIGQGLSNVAGSFLSCFTSSGSFNRSAAHYEAGARTPMAAVYASIFLAVIVLLGGKLIAFIPMAAVSGSLILVGYGLIDLRDIRQAWRSRQETVIYTSTLLVALVFGLNSGVFIGVVLSLIVYLWFAATPNINLNEYTARDGRQVQSITIDGNLFFGSVRHVEAALERLAEQRSEAGILLFRTDHVTYMDASGANLVANEMKRQRDIGGETYVYVSRDDIMGVLRTAGLLESFGEERMIRRDSDHPMKDILFPYRARFSDAAPGTAGATPKRIESTIEALAKRLRTTRLLGPLSADQIATLLRKSPIRMAPAGDIIIKADHPMTDHMILLEGEIEVQRTWSVPGSEHDKSHTRHLTPASAESSFCFLSAASSNVRVRAVSDIRYLLLDADAADDLLGWSQQFRDIVQDSPELQARVNLVRETGIFHELPLENVVAAFKRLQVRSVQPGDVVMNQGDPGDAYYIIEEGEAEVRRTDPFSDETRTVATLGAGDAFGEEALLQNAARNASVIMTTPGQLLVLAKGDFDDLVKSKMMMEISAEEAQQKLKEGKARIIDCRYDMEYRQSRIPGAAFLPLDEMRHRVHELDPDDFHIVYCRSGRRSKAAVFLLKERNIDAVSLAGGIKNWPYEIDETLAA